jgi:hypothetical protein
MLELPDSIADAHAGTTKNRAFVDPGGRQVEKQPDHTGHPIPEGI